MKAGEDSDLPLTGFINGLFEDAHARVPQWSQASREDRVAAANYLQTIHEQLALEAPDAAPEFHETSAMWAAEVIHWSCWTLLNRVQEETRLPPSLAQAKPSGTAPAEHWSVDLTFRFFASILDQARRLAHQDPLCSTLESIVSDWPFSAIGCGLAKLDVLNASRVQGVVSSDSLLLSMRDRVLERKDRAWIEAGPSQFQYAGRLRELIAEAIGAQEQFLPVGWKLESEPSPSE